MNSELEQQKEEISQFWTVRNGSELLALVTEQYKSVKGDAAATMLKLKSASTDSFTPKELSTALEIVQGRDRLVKSGLAWAAKGLFLNRQLQQSSHQKLLSHHAAAFRGLSLVADVCCGLGFDTAAIARVATQVLAVEFDPSVAAFAEHNLRVQGLENCRVLCMSAEEFFSGDVPKELGGLWVDPDRRSASGERKHRGAEYSPPLDTLFSLEVQGPVGIKVSPLFDDAELPSDCSREILGCDRETREQILWLNREMPPFTVSVVDEGFRWEAKSHSVRLESTEDIVAGQFVVEPHNALRQSNMIHDFFSEHGIVPLKGIPLGVVDAPIEESVLKAYEVISVCGYRPKELSRELKKRSFGKSLTIKKCGLSESVEAIRSNMKFSKEDLATPEDVLFVMALGKKKVAVFCKRV